MRAPIRLFIATLTVSFLGTLPLGTLNLSVANYTYRQDWPGAVGFSVGAILVEMIMVHISFLTLYRLEKLKLLFRTLTFLAILLLLFLSFSSLHAAWQTEAFKAVLLFPDLNPFVSGLALSLINPLHLPFWLGWVAVFRSKKMVENTSSHRHVFLAGAGAGTLMAFGLYAVAGSYLIPVFDQHYVLLNWVVGVSLLVASVTLTLKLLAGKNILLVIRKDDMHQ